MQQSILAKTEKFVYEQLIQDASGHDWYHIDRVRKLALHIAKQERKGDLFTIEMAALLHDIPDDKLNESEKDGQAKLDGWLERMKIDRDTAEHIQRIISTISFSAGQENLPSIEASIVQDADRLDAIGAIGIARTFAYGGKKGQPMYDPEVEVRHDMTKEEYRNGKSSSVHHFYEKLLLLKDRLNTETARAIAKERHQYMVDFLQEFYKEWDARI